MPRNMNADGIPSKLSFLLRLSELQRCFPQRMFEAESAKNGGELKKAAAIYARLLESMEAWLEVALAHNEHHDAPIDVPLHVESMINVMSMHADVLDSLGRALEAEAQRKKVLDLSERYLGNFARAEVMRGQAAALTAKGRFNDALVTLSAARDYFEKQGDPGKMARTTMDMVDLLQWLGDYRRAGRELDRAANLIAKSQREGVAGGENVLQSLMGIVEANRLVLELDYYRGLIAKALGDYESAESHMKRVLPQYQRMGAGPAIEFQLASIALRKGDAARALEWAQSLEPVFRKGGMLRPKLAALYHVQAQALTDVGKPEDAVRASQAGIRDLETFNDPDLLWRVQYQEGRALRRAGSVSDALAAFARAADTVNGLRKSPLGYRLDSCYLEDKRDLFSSAISLASREGRGAECAAFVEMIKSRALTTIMSIPGGGAREETGEREPRSAFREITLEIDSNEYQQYKEGPTAEMRDKKKELLARRADLLERIRFSDPRWRMLSEPVPFDIRKVGRSLSERNQAAITLYHEPERVTAVMISGGRVETDTVAVKPETRQRLGWFLENLQAEQPDPPFNDPSSALGIRADHFIPRNLLLHALQNESLVIIPHGPLHLLPWAGLMFDGKRLFERCPVGILPNLSSVALLTMESGVPSASVIGPPEYAQFPALRPLPGALREVGEIGRMYSARSRLFSPVVAGQAATEAGFWKLATDAGAAGGILHVACHGVFEALEPMNSGLLFEESKVDAAEIARSKVPYDEVILSSCNSGWRPFAVEDVTLAGDDILGIPGAFLEAGAKSVLVSIPPADDEAAAQFMFLYHGFRLDGHLPMNSLQRTQKALLREGLAPHRWIGFTVYGCW